MDNLQKKHNKMLVFRARITPRILPSKQNERLCIRDLERYNKHLYNVFTAVPAIDNRAPKLNPYNYMNISRAEGDAKRLEALDRDNRHFVSRINAINRGRAFVDCWNVYKRGIPGPAACKYMNDSKRIMRDNKKILNLIKTAKSLYSRKYMRKEYKKISKEFEGKIKQTKVFHIKKRLDKRISEQPSISSGLDLEFPIPRRRAFLNFSFKNGAYLGKVIIELYSEFAPKIVKNFLEHCDENSEYNYKNCRIHYGEKGKFFACGDVTLQNGKGGHSIFKKKRKMEENELKHTRIGILLAVPITEPDTFDPCLTIRQRIKKKPCPPTFNSQFAITLNCKNFYDQRAAIFGKVVKGNAVLVKINDMLKRCGTPLETIIITDCGVIPYTKRQAKELEIVKINMALAGIPFEQNFEEESEEEEDALDLV